MFRVDDVGRPDKLNVLFLWKSRLPAGIRQCESGVVLSVRVARLRAPHEELSVSAARLRARHAELSVRLFELWAPHEALSVRVSRLRAFHEELSASHELELPASRNYPPA